MGTINLKHTGSGSDVTLSSDGTDLLLDGTAIGGGGGGADLYAANPSSATNPTANALNSVAIGDGMTTGSSAVGGIAIGQDGTVSGTNSVSLGKSGAYGTGSFAAAISNVAYQTYGADGDYSISVGYRSRASSSGAIAIGYEAKSLNNYSTAISRSYASGADSFAAAIANNSSSYGATGANSVAIGYQSKAEDAYAIALNGGRADGSSSLAWSTNSRARFSRSIALGYNAYSNADNAIALGENSRSDVKGKIAFSNFVIAPTYSQGSAQRGQYILGCQTSDATATTMTSDNSSTAAFNNQVLLHDHEAVAFEILLVGRQDGTDGSACAAWKMMGLINRASGAANTTLVNSSTTVIDNTPSWGTPALSADTTNGCLKVQVTGAASTDIAWVATVTTSELTHS